MSGRRVFVAGAGVISAIGKTLPENLQSFEKYQSGIGKMQYLNSHYRDTLPVGEVKFSNAQLSQALNVKSIFNRTSLLGIHAAREAVMNSSIPDLKRWRTGLISATTVGGMDRTEDFFIAFLKDKSQGRLHDVINHECGRSTEAIADALGISDFLSTINTACSSSVNAVILGTRMIRAGLLDVVIAGGTDALTRFTINGFNSLMILDQEPCRPFDATRNGLNLGEGAGYIVLVSENVAREENMDPRVCVAGYANTNDAYHQTASSPEGRGSYSAMIQSLQMSGLSSVDIDYINLHGTGTMNNDQSEGTAIKRLFGDRIPRLSSTKSFTGHTLGACGGIEAAYSVRAIEAGVVYPNLRFNHPMEGMDICPEVEFQTKVDIKNVMSNSFGFGGNCSSIIFSRN